MNTAGSLPKLIFALIFGGLGGALIGLGAYRIVTAYPFVELACNRAENVCRLTEASLIHTKRQEFKLQELRGTQLRTFPSGRRGSQYQVLLTLDGRVLELGEPAFGEEGHRALGLQVQQFLDAPAQPALAARRDSRSQVYGSTLMAIAIGLPFALVGIGSLPFWKRRQRA